MNIMQIGAVLLILGAPVAVHAQDSSKAANKVQQTAKTVGNKTAEVASKAKAGVVDQKYKNKVGPNGEKIYIDHDSKYYWIDDKGKKQYIDESQLKDK